MGVPLDEIGQTTRRNLLVGVTVAGVAVTVAGCSSDSGSTSSSGGGGSTPIKTSDIPVGGGRVYDDQKVVVTQPSAGQFKAFTAICTHQGCTVSKIENGTITCPCHGSQFSATDGSVKNGPAQRPLDAKTVTVSGDTITVS
jgi:Rieske Fe-S protein